MKSIFVSSREVKIPFSEMKRLQSTGVLEIGISKSLAVELAARNITPSNKLVKSAFAFSNIAAIIILLISVYFSFAEKWWYFIVGFILFFIIAAANRDGNSQNYIEQALVDENFYETISAIGGWTFKVDATVLDALKQNSSIAN